MNSFRHEKDEADIPQKYECKNDAFTEKAGNEVEQLSVWELPGVYGSTKKPEQDKDDEK